MNAAELYKHATGKVPEQAVETILKSKITLATEAQKEEISWRSWLSHPVTAQFFADIETQISELDSSARELALNYHNTQNHQAIITALIKSATLRQIQETTNAKSQTTTAKP